MIIRKDGSAEQSSSTLNKNLYINENNFIIDETTEEGQLMAKAYMSNYPFVDFEHDGEFVTKVIVLEKPVKPIEIEGKKIKLVENEQGEWKYIYVDIPLTPEQQEIKLLKAQVQANADISDFHEELIVELAMMLY